MGPRLGCLSGRAPAAETDCSLLLSLVPWALTLWLTPQQISPQMISLWQWDIFIAFHLISPWELLFAFTRYYQETKATKTHFNFSGNLALLLSDNGRIRTLSGGELDPRVRRWRFLSGQWPRLLVQGPRALWASFSSRADPLQDMPPNILCARMSFVVQKTWAKLITRTCVF